MNQHSGVDPTSISSPDTDLHDRYGMIAIGLLLVPFVINALHAVPSSDDFCYAAQSDKSGYLNSIAHYYGNVNGRFFATFLIVSLEWLFPIEHTYAAGPMFFFAALACAFVMLFRAVLPPQAGWPRALTLGLMSSLVLIANVEVPAEVFYWLSGSATYLSATAFTLAVLAAMLALVRHELRGARFWGVTTCGAVAAIAASGSAEITGPVLLASGATCIFIAYVLRRPAVMGLAVVTAAAALGLWLNLSAPGTATRAEVIALGAGRDMTDLVVIVLRSILWTSEHLANWATRASLWAVALVVFLSLRGELAAVWSRDTRHRRAAVAALAGLFALPYLAAFPMFYAYGVPHPERAHATIDALCMFFWLAVLSLGFAQVQRAVALQGLRQNRRLLSIGVFAAFFLTVAGTWNFHHASLDTLRGIAYAREAAAQMDEVAGRPERAWEIVVTRRRAAYAPTLAVSDITPDPRRWRNVCFAEFLGAQGVRIEADPDDPGFEFKPEGWTDPDPQAIGRPRPPWPGA